MQVELEFLRIGHLPNYQLYFTQVNKYLRTEIFARRSQRSTLWLAMLPQGLVITYDEVLKLESRIFGLNVVDRLP